MGKTHDGALLGIGQTSDIYRFTPQKLQLPVSSRVIAACAGLTYSALLTGNIPSPIFRSTLSYTCNSPPTKNCLPLVPVQLSHCKSAPPFLLSPCLSCPPSPLLPLPYPLISLYPDRSTDAGEVLFFGRKISGVPLPIDQEMIYTPTKVNGFGSQKDEKFATKIAGTSTTIGVLTGNIITLTLP